jgi:hypothetical protein
MMSFGIMSTAAAVPFFAASHSPQLYYLASNKRSPHSALANPWLTAGTEFATMKRTAGLPSR